MIELECDFRVFYRIDDIYTMPAARFFAYARRCIAYHGAIRREWELEIAEEAAAADEFADGDQYDRLTSGGGEISTVSLDQSYLLEDLEVLMGNEEVMSHGGR